MRPKQQTAQKQGFMQSIKNAIPNNCSNCGYKYQEKDLTLVQKDDYTAILHLTCANCKESYLINVVSPLGTLQGSSRIPLKIDITSAKEAKKFVGKKPVSSNDVLNTHELLGKIKYGEEFNKILKNKSRNSQN